MNQLQRSTPFALPIKFIQFGEGNFLRAFIDWQIDLLNEHAGLNAGVVIVRPRGHSVKPLLDEQGGLYNVLIEGLNDAGQPVRQFRTIQCVQREINPLTMFDAFVALAHNPNTRYVVSNTTEAGIAVNQTDRFEDRPPLSFPAKLTRLLYERFRRFQGAPDKGWVMLPCELIEHNGLALKAAVLHFANLWHLGAQFQHWLEHANTFCSTLVDRIVTGYPAQQMDAIDAELGYHDRFLVAAEYYYAFQIEGPAWLADELKLADAGLDIRLVDDIGPYRQTKVGILNGGHTVLVPLALLAGLESVGAAVHDHDLAAFLLRTWSDEIIPALSLPPADLERFCADVLRRFKNPYMHHKLASIALNSWPKFAARVMPQLLRYHELKGKLPNGLVLALAATLVLYRGEVITLADDEHTVQWFEQAWADVDSQKMQVAELVAAWLGNAALWGRDLNQVDGLCAAVVADVAAIRREGVRNSL